MGEACMYTKLSMLLIKSKSGVQINCFKVFLAQVQLRQKYYAPQVRPYQDSNPWLPDHDSTFHVTETPALTIWPAVTCQVDRAVTSRSKGLGFDSRCQSCLLATFPTALYPTSTDGYLVEQKTNCVIVTDHWLCLPVKWYLSFYEWVFTAQKSHYPPSLLVNWESLAVSIYIYYGAQGRIL